MRTVLAASLAAALVITAGCANIPEESSPQAVPRIRTTLARAALTPGAARMPFCGAGTPAWGPEVLARHERAGTVRRTIALT